MAGKLQVIGFDADDTLWHNERFFQLTQARFAELLSDHAPEEDLMQRLEAAERRNLGRYGFGIKGFTLSMIETAIEVTEARVPASVLQQILEAGREMLAHPVDLLPHAEEAVRRLAETHRIVLITKGDLLDQERKLAQSGLGDHFDAVEIVSDKTPAVYARIFGEAAPRALMVGNSMKSDVLPALEAGAHAAHVPHELAWSFEHAAPPRAPELRARFHEVADLSGLPGLVARLEGS